MNQTVKSVYCAIICEILISPALNSLLSTECQVLICLIMQENHSNNVNDSNFPFPNWIIFGGGVMPLAVQRNWLLKIPLASPRCSVQFVWSCCSLEIFELCSDPLQKFCWEHFCWSRRKTNPDPCYFNKIGGDCVHMSRVRPPLCRWQLNNEPGAALGFGKHNLMVSLADASKNMSVWKFGHQILAASFIFYSFEFFMYFSFSPF